MNKLLDCLSTNEKEKIKGYIRNYASHSGHDCDNIASVEHILRYWDAEKMDLFQLLGEKLIVKKEFSYNESLNDTTEKMGKIVRYKLDNALCNSFIKKYKNLPSEHSFPWEVSSGIFSLIDDETLAKNVYTGYSREVPLPKGKTIKINKGCRPVKTIGKIAKAFGIEEGFEEFRIAHSIALNQKTLTGRMCLSIHPLDFMTMSDNDSDWSSCMSWIGEGCYRQGTVEMMNSPMVLVAYLESEEPMTLFENEKWNSKKWRELFIVNDSVITNIKSYPYKSEELTETALTWLKELAEKNTPAKYEDYIVHWNNENKDDDEILFERRIRFRFSTNLMYNDFHANTGQSTYLGVKVKDDSILKFNYSGESECMFCGGPIDFDSDYEDMEKYLCCSECEGLSFCDRCDRLITDDDGYYYVDGERLCEYCYEHATCETLFDGDVHLTDDCDRIYLAYDEDAPVEGREYYSNWWASDKIKVKEGDKAVIDSGAMLWTSDVDRTAKTYTKNGEFEIITQSYLRKCYVIRFSNVTDTFAEDMGFTDAEELIRYFKQKKEIKID